MTHFEQTISGTGGFKVGDLVQSTYLFEGKGLVEKARIIVSRPTKLVSFCIRAHGSALLLSHMVVKKYSQDDIKGEPDLLFQQEIPFVPLGKEDIQEACFIDIYPKMNVLYELHWAFDKEAYGKKAEFEAVSPFSIQEVEM